MTYRTSWCALIVVASVAALGCTGAGSTDIDGTWAVAAGALGGENVPVADFQGSKLRLIAGSYQFQDDSGSYTVIAGANPAAMVIHGAKGPNTARTIPAIFKLHNDTLTICYDLSGTARPTKFSSDSGTQLLLMRYTRATK